MIKDALIRGIDPLLFYRKFFPTWDGHSNVCCPFHKDKSPSFAINKTTGAAYCHGGSCGAKIADVVHFFERYKKISSDHAIKVLHKMYNIPVEKDDEKLITITPKHVAFWRDKLSHNITVKKLLFTLRGLGEETLERYHIGFDPATERIMLPIYSAKGRLVNVRKYNLIRRDPAKHTPKMIGIKGAPCDELYPIWRARNDDSSDIILFGGELDALLARQAGFNAVSSISGEGVFRTAWIKHFKNKKVWLCLDNDAPGRAASKKIREQFASSGIKATRVLLPFNNPKIHKDFTDWVIKEGHNAERLGEYLKKSPESEALEDLTEAEAIGLSEVMQSRNYGKKFDIHCQIAAKVENPFIIPNKFKLVCSGTNAGCPVCMSDEATMEYVIPKHKRELLQFADTTDKNCRNMVKELVGVPFKCTPIIAPIGHTSLNEVWVIPDTSYSEGSYTMQKAYFTGDNVTANRPYKMTAHLVSSPQNQKSVLLATQLEATQSTVDMFYLTRDIRKALNTLRPKTDTLEGVMEKLFDIADDHSRCRTFIIDRPDLHLATMLTYHSILEFQFDTPRIERGWVNTLIVGDTASGKSKVSENLRMTYRAGDWASGENASVVGLLGGVVQLDGQWAARWGKIPLNDQRLVILEELSGIEAHDIARLTEVRSSGVASIDKAGLSTKAHSRTRLIFLSNTRKGKNLKDYPSGAVAISELIGNNEDVRRFDIVLTVRNAEASLEKINTFVTSKVSKYPSEIHQMSVAWAWSLKPEQVKFSKQAKEACKRLALEMAKKYHDSIPLFKGEDGRYKLARLGAAIAAQLFCCDEKGCLTIKECHIEAAHQYLNTAYDKKSMGYHDYSKLAHRMETLGKKKSVIEVLATISNPVAYQRTMEMFLSSVCFTPEEFEGASDLDEITVKNNIRALFRERAIIKDKNGWSATHQFRDWLKKQAPHITNGHTPAQDEGFIVTPKTKNATHDKD